MKGLYKIMPQQFVVCLQTSLSHRDYQSEAKFASAINKYIEDAIKQEPELEKQDSNAIIVFPEMIGMWLFIASIKLPSMFFTYCNNHLIPMLYVTVMNLVTIITMFIKEWWILDRKKQTRKSPTLSSSYIMGNLTRCLFKYNADLVLEIYVRVFSSLARQYSVYIVAGSIVLPKLQLHNGQVRNTEQGLYNISLTFDPNGNVCNIEYKQYLTQEELDIVDVYIPEKQDNQHSSFETEVFGTVACLICADGWYPSCYQDLMKVRPDIIVNPSLSIPGDEWLDPWSGYSAWQMPSDVQVDDLRKISLEEAWMKYSSPTRARIIPSVTCTVLCQGILKLWDMTGNGRSCVVIKRGDEVIVTEAPNHLDSAIIVCKL
jgi:predicted amidohydrolase